MSRKLHTGPFSYDDDEDYVPTKKVKYSSRDDDSLHKKKHTLDSDEEDEDSKEETKKFNVLKDEDIDGQEDSTIDFEGETKITPFNMKEEMEDGHFDKDGFYHFNKDPDKLKDAWLDNIDWVKVKHQDDIKKYGSDLESESDDESKLPESTTEKEKRDLIAVYEEIFPLLKSGESVAKALKRLGGNTKRLSSAERWKLKKQGKLASPGGSNMEEFMKLTELANKIIETGNMDAYEETYEMINLKIQRYKAGPITAPTKPSMDMFSDEMSASKAESTKTVDNGNDNSEQKDTFDDIQWEFRWENNDAAEIHGPFTTDQMVKWKESNYFKKGVYVRKTSEKMGPWYLSSRIDFDIYT